MCSFLPKLHILPQTVHSFVHSFITHIYENSYCVLAFWVTLGIKRVIKKKSTISELGNITAECTGIHKLIIRRRCKGLKVEVNVKVLWKHRERPGVGERCHGGFCLHRIIAVALSVSCVWSFCDSMDFSPPSSSVHGISQARIQEWVAISFFRESSWSRHWIHVSWIGRWILTTEQPGKPHGVIGRNKSQDRLTQAK